MDLRRNRFDVIFGTQGRTHTPWMRRHQARTYKPKSFRRFRLRSWISGRDVRWLPRANRSHCGRCRAADAPFHQWRFKIQGMF